MLHLKFLTNNDNNNIIIIDYNNDFSEAQILTMAKELADGSTKKLRQLFFVVAIIVAIFFESSC